jgi:hypothetical protein
MARDNRRIGTYESCALVGTVWSVEEEEGRAPSSIFEISKFFFVFVNDDVDYRLSMYYSLNDFNKLE